MFTCVAIRCIPIGTTRLRLVGVMSNLFFSRPQQSGRHATHGWLVTILERRIADRRVVRLIQKWLNAGVLEDGKRIRVEEGTPQGGSASPFLANVYLHYVFDLWVQAWRQKRAHGDVIVVRFADGTPVQTSN